MASDDEKLPPTWTVVEFRDSNTVESVPSTWIDGQQCYWPPVSKEKLLTDIKKCCMPNHSWPLYNVRVFKDATYDNYSLARLKARKAENTSDLNSDSDMKRKPKPRKIYSSSDSEAELTLLEKPPTLSQQKSRSTVIPHVISGSKNVQESVASADMTTCSSFGSVQTCSCEQYQKKNEVILKEILSKQSLLRAQLSQIMDNLNTLIIRADARNSESTNNGDQSISFLKKFEMPINTLDLLENEVNTYLSDEMNYRYAVKELSKMGGQSPYDFIKRCLSNIMTNELAEKFSFYGAKKKKAFKDLKLWEVLKDAALKVNAEYTNSIAEEGVKKWLRRAKERTDYLHNKLK